MAETVITPSRGLKQTVSNAYVEMSGKYMLVAEFKYETAFCSPKYTVLLHLGQMLGPPEKDEKLAAAKVTMN